MICHICGKAGAKERLVTETMGKGENMLLIENVPLITCPNCGESYYTAKTLHDMESIRQQRRGAIKREIEVAPFEMVI